MRTFRLVTIAVAIGWGAPVALADEPKDQLFALFEDNECSMTFEAADQAMIDLGLSRQQADKLTVDLLNQGTFAIGAGEKVYLKSGAACETVEVPAVDADPAAVVAVIEFFEQRDCVVSLDEGPIPALRGEFDHQTLIDAVMYLGSRQAFEFDEENSRYLAGPICGKSVE